MCSVLKYLKTKAFATRFTAKCAQAPCHWRHYPNRWIAGGRNVRTRWADAVLETQRQTADDTLRRADDQQLVINRLVGGRAVEEGANRDEHLPLRVAEIEERQRLPHLHVKPAVRAWPRDEIAASEPVADAVEHHHARRCLRHVGFERR